MSKSKEVTLSKYSTDLLMAILARGRCPSPNCNCSNPLKVVMASKSFIKVSESRFICQSCMSSPFGAKLNTEAAEKYASKYGLKIKKE